MIKLEVAEAKIILKYSPLVITAGLLIALVWLNLETIVNFSATKIPSPKIISVEDQKLAPSGMKVEFKTEKFYLNTNPHIYQTSQVTAVTEQLATSLAKKLGFSEQIQTTDNTIFNWKKGSENLIVNKKSNFLDYAASYGEKELSSYSRPDLAQAKTLFKEFYKKLSFSTDFIRIDSPEEVVFSRTITSFTNSEDKTAEILPGEANFITLLYPVLVENKPLVGRFPIVYRAEATFARGNKLISAKIPIILGSWKKTLEFPSLDKETLKSEMEKGKATLVSYSAVLHKSFPKIDPLEKVAVTSIKTAYLAAAEGYQYTVPIYIIEADCITDQAGQVKATFYLAAFKSVFFR